jgi:hypothetical protein
LRGGRRKYCPGEGNSHILDNIPLVLVGNGLDFRTGHSLKYPRVPHNRLLLALAHGFGHRIPRFGNPGLLRRRPALGADLIALGRAQHGDTETRRANWSRQCWR